MALPKEGGYTTGTPPAPTPTPTATKSAGTTAVPKAPATAPATNVPTNPNAAAPAAATGSTSNIPAGYGWVVAPFEHYVGRDPNAQELRQIQQGGYNYDTLVEHLRQQPSHVKGMTMGALEDYHKVASPYWFQATGQDVTDTDIQSLVNAGARTGDDIKKYIFNRPDVVAAHPGMPLGLTDEQYGQHKAAIDSEYQANLGRSATDEEARTAYSQSASPFRKAPAEQFGLSSGVTGGGKTSDLISQAQIAPNARSLGIPGVPGA